MRSISFQILLQQKQPQDQTKSEDNPSPEMIKQVINMQSKQTIYLCSDEKFPEHNYKPLLQSTSSKSV